MTDGSTDAERSATTDGETTPSPVEVGRDALASGWGTLKTVYYANSFSWRFLKSGTLLFLGFFLWVGSNLLYSYNPELTLLRYPMAYGFVLLVYGPIHHLVVLPLSFRWRRGSGGRQRVGRRLPNAMLAIFLVVVVVLGTFPAGAMTVDFRGTLESSGADISPDLLCVKSDTGNGTEIHCHLSESAGIDTVVVESGGEELLVDDGPPFEFTIHERELRSVTGEKQFTVILRDEDGGLLRRYTRRLSMIDTG